MTIKEVSEKFHMTADTLRYYEKNWLNRFQSNGMRVESGIIRKQI